MKQRVLILGGGFGGLYTALELERTLARDPDVEITLINHDNFFLFTPMLHEVAASDLDITHIVNPIRKLLRRVKFLQGDVEAVDLRGKTVTVAHGDDHHTHALEYDQLIVALGNVTNFYGIPGLAGRAFTMKTLGDAIDLRNRLIQNIEQADFECSAEFRRPLLTVVVAGGGFAGVETTAGINDFLREAVRFYPNLKETDIRIVLVHLGHVLLPELSETLGRYAEEKLRARGVDIRLGAGVRSFSGNTVELGNGDRIDSATLVWTAGTAPHPTVAGLPVEKERGRIRTNRFMEVPEYPGVWAVGDCAAVPTAVEGQFYPPTAQHAIREGRVLARNLTAALRGGTKSPFVFTTIGQLAAIGHRTGVANILGMHFSGFVAWWLWRTIYLSKLPRLEKKVRVAFDWTLDLLFSKDLVQFTAARPAVQTKAVPAEAARIGA